MKTNFSIFFSAFTFFSLAVASTPITTFDKTVKTGQVIGRKKTAKGFVFRGEVAVVTSSTSYNVENTNPLLLMERYCQPGTVILSKDDAKVLCFVRPGFPGEKI